MSRLLPSVILFTLVSIAAPSRAAEITTIAGNGKPATAGDNGPATSASLHDPFGITRGPDGLLYICEFNGHAVRRIAADGSISTIAGTGKPGFSGDGGPATSAQLNKPHEIRFGPDGALYISDMSTHTIRRVDMSNGTISTFAGTGKPGFSGNGGPASAASLSGPKGLASDSRGRIYIADTESHSIRVIDPATGLISVVAGTGSKGNASSPNPLQTQLARPHGVFIDKDGSLYIGDSENHVVRRVTGLN